MASVNVLVLRAPGINCDLETEHAWNLAGAHAERIHLERLIERPDMLDRFRILTIPGGFSYGDDIAAGRIFAARLDRHLHEPLRAFIASGRLVLGICNGFQILVEAGLLPNPLSDGSSRSDGSGHPDDSGRRDDSERMEDFVHPNDSGRIVGADGPSGAVDAGTSPGSTVERVAVRTVCAVTDNEPPGFQDRWVRVRAGKSRSRFLAAGREYDLPIAHGEGRVVFRDADAVSAAEAAGLNALCYVDGAPGNAHGRMSANPNGSDGGIAGLCDPSGCVLGLMPHPERFVVRSQHPECADRSSDAEGDGLAIFRAAVLAMGGG